MPDPAGVARHEFGVESSSFGSGRLLSASKGALGSLCRVVISAQRHLGLATAAAAAAICLAPSTTGGDLDGALPHGLGLALRKEWHPPKASLSESNIVTGRSDDPVAREPNGRAAGNRGEPADRKPDDLTASKTAELAAGPVATFATLVNVHTGEVFPLSPSEPSDDRFSASLADRTTGAKLELDPRLLDLLRRLAEKNAGARIELVSGFRSPKLNEMLRKKGHNVASHSQHSLGHAVDFRIVGLTPRELRREILDLGWEGGIGEYDKYWDNFVHADVGPKRYWFER